MLLPTLCSTYVSVGHRETLVQHHTHILLLAGEQGDGEWEIVTREVYIERLKTAVPPNAAILKGSATGGMLAHTACVQRLDAVPGGCVCKSRHAPAPSGTTPRLAGTRSAHTS